MNTFVWAVVIIAIVDAGLKVYRSLNDHRQPINVPDFAISLALIVWGSTLLAQQ